MKYTHTNINSPNWVELVNFYSTVFDCQLLPPLRHLHGAWFEAASGIKGAEVYGAHIALPGYEAGGPTLEIFTHTVSGAKESTAWNEGGFAHIAIEVDDVEKVYKKLLENGGSADGKITSNYYPALDKSLTMIYAKDPDGNCIEIQSWRPGKQK